MHCCGARISGVPGRCYCGPLQFFGDSGKSEGSLRYVLCISRGEAVIAVRRGSGMETGPDQCRSMGVITTTVWVASAGNTSPVKVEGIGYKGRGAPDIRVVRKSVGLLLLGQTRSRN